MRSLIFMLMALSSCAGRPLPQQATDGAGVQDGAVDIEVFGPTTPLDRLQGCVTVSDCVRVEEGCCRCPMVAINKAWAQLYRARFGCGDLSGCWTCCPFSYTTAPLACVAGRCVLSLPERSLNRCEKRQPDGAT
jgi:hypothetical protein